MYEKLAVYEKTSLNGYAGIDWVYHYISGIVIINCMRIDADPAGEAVLSGMPIQAKPS